MCPGRNRIRSRRSAKMNTRKSGSLEMCTNTARRTRSRTPTNGSRNQMLPRHKISGRIIKRRIILREELAIVRGRILGAGTIAAGKTAVAKIVDRIRAEDAAADSGAVVDAVAEAVLALLPAGAICRRQNMLRRKDPGKHAGRSAVTIVEMIAAGRDRIAEDRIADSNRADLKTAGRKIPGMVEALQ